MNLPDKIGPWTIAHISEFMQLDDDHINFRRFKRLHLWTTLRLQHRLIKLDDQVARYEEISNDSEPNDEMLSEATELLEKYARALLAHKQCLEMKAIPAHIISPIKNFAERKRHELADELEPGGGWDDLVSIGTAPTGWLHRLAARSQRLQRLFQDRRNNNRHPSLFFYSNKSIRRVEEAAVNFLFGCTLMIPVCILTYLQSKDSQWKDLQPKVVALAVVLVSLVATSLLTSVLADQTQRSSLAVMAAYIAILVVFLSGGGGS